MIATLYRLSEPNTLFRNVVATGVEREFIRVVSGSGVIRDVSAVSAGRTESPNLACGIKFQNTAADYLVQRAKMVGFWTNPAPGKTYVNGDGISSELANARLTFASCQTDDCGDGGFDLKGAEWRLESCNASRNEKNFRFWSRGSASLLRSWNPRSVHVHICPAIEHTEQQVIEIDTLQVTGPGVMLLVETVAGAIPPKIIIGKVVASGITTPLRIIGAAPEIIGLTLY